MPKERYINELKEGDKLEDVFLVKSSRLAETRAGKPYLLLDLLDKTGDLSCPVWNDAEHVATFCQSGGFVIVRGQVQLYRERLQLRLESIAPVEKSKVHLADFVPASQGDPEEMGRAIQRLVATIEDLFVRRLLNRFFKKGEIWDRFKRAPAAKGIHHAYIGGLIEHCLSMAGVADMLSQHYPGVNRSLLLAGVLLHDIGKLKELDEEMGIVEYTDQGRLKGHLVMGSEMVAEAASRISDFPPETLVQLQHLILSHHGRQEFGSPTVPMTIEALMLSMIDDLDAKMNLIEQLRRKNGGDKMQWSEYQRTLERFLYLSPLNDDEGQAGSGAEEATRQQSLF